MRKLIILALLVLAVGLFADIPFAQRSVQDTDVIQITDSNGQVYKMTWAQVYAYIRTAAAEIEGTNLTLTGTLTVGGVAELDTTLAVTDGITAATISCTTGTFSGTVTAEQLTSTDDATITGDLTAATVSCTTGTFSGTVQAEQLTSTDDLSVTDAITAASIACTTGTFTGTVQAEQLTSTDDASIADSLYVADDIVVGDDVTIIGDIDIDGVSNVDNIDIDGTYDHTASYSGGANTAIMNRMNLTAGETFSGTTGFQVKIYDADTTVVHSGGEHCGVYVNMKQLSEMADGGKSVLYSGHNYGSGGNYQVIDAGVWLYGNLVDAYKVSGGSIVTGLDLSETTITGQELLGCNSESLDNLTDGVWNMGAAALQAASYNFCGTVGGTADAITLDFTPDLAALAAGLRVTFVADSANTGAATLAIDGGTAKAIYEASDVSALDANDIRAGMVVDLIYDGTQWQQISQSGN